MATKFKDYPHSAFIDAVVEHIRKTGEPETCDGLFQGRIPRDAKYRIIRRIDIDGRKRRNGDRASCPMCTPNRFLEGRLVWLPDLQCVSIIGHCCAVHADQAEREYKQREDQKREEDFLLSSLPLLKDKAAILTKLRPAGEEALRLFRKLRANAPTIQRHLRAIKDRGNAQLRVTEILRSRDTEDTADDHFGPAGFRGQGDFSTDSRDHDFGVIAGTTALIRDYRPVVELNDAVRMSGLFPFDGGEEDALELLVQMTHAERRASVANIQMLDRQYEKFIRRIRDFAQFFSADNIKRLHAYGSSPHTHFQMEAKREATKGRVLVTLRHGTEDCRLVVGSQLYATDFSWRAATF